MGWSSFRNWLVVAAAGLGLAGTGIGRASEPAEQDLAAEVKQLRAEVQELKAKQMSAADVDMIVRSVLDDADRRSTMLGAEGFTAGYDKGKFLIQSADGSFVMNPWLQVQFRNITNYRGNAKSTKASSTENNWDNGFELRRAKFGFSGNLFTPDFTYTAFWGTDRKTGGLTLEEFWGRYQFAEDWGVKTGQFKGPLTHEGLNSSKRLLAADKSYLQNKLAYGENYLQGVSLLYGGKTNPVHIEVAWTDGANSANTNFQDGAAGSIPPLGGTVAPNYGAAGRVEWLAFGDWKAYEQFTALDAKADTLVLGAAVDYTEYPGSFTAARAATPTSLATNALRVPNAGVVVHTFDAQYVNPNGLGLYGAYIGRYTKYDYAVSGQNPDETYDWGVLVQASFLLNRQWEIFGRYDYTGFDGKTPAGVFGSLPTGVTAGSLTHHVNEFTAGVNYYIKGQAAKFTFDVVYLPNGAPIGDDSIGVLQQTRDGEQFLLRGQFQLLI